MMRKATILILSALLMALSMGCAGTLQQASTDEAGPLELHYDIQYVDNTAIGIEVLVMSPELPFKIESFERGMDRAFEQVAYRLPKSTILERQADFRDVLAATFKAETGIDEASLFLMNIYQTTWDERGTVLTLK
ncbi:hypothetical protein KQI63_08470 [bacterium]|nr:hypothetical protein [bacterium]